METSQQRHPHQDGVRGRAAASGAAGGRQPLPAGRERVSVPAVAAALDGRAMAAGLFAANMAGVLGGRCHGPSNAAEAKERGCDGLPPRAVATTACLPS